MTSQGLTPATLDADAQPETVDYHQAHNGKTHRAYRGENGVITTLCGLGNNKPHLRPRAITGQCEAGEITCGRCK